MVRLRLLALGYNLGRVLRGLAVPSSVRHRLLTTLREKEIKVGARVVRHAGYVTFQMAEVAVPRDSLAAVPEQIQRFGVPPPRGRRLAVTKPHSGPDFRFGLQERGTRA